ncbi:MAG: flagellar hook-associated protein FlgL [Proteobacteria bacterium]|nr:flagellar hook-associated protein FlgL [Pseudomonadota bacterium]
MRVTDKLRFDVFKNNLSSLKETLDKTQTRIASGKKILAPSDDPIAASAGVALEAEKNLNDRYKKNLEKLKTVGGFYDTSINSINDLLTRAKEISITQASDTMDASTRISANEEIKGIIEQLVTIGNTKVGNNYIFGGKKSNMKPFTIDADYNVTFNGSSDVDSIYVDKGTKEDAGISGQSVFISDTNVFTVLKNFSDALDGNDLTGIGEAIDNIDNSLEKTQTNLAHAGTYMARVENYIGYKETRDVDITESLSQMTDIDMTQAVTDFNTLSTAYEAMLYSMAKVQSLTILNYLN